MDKLKKMTSYRLFWPIVCLALVLLFNLIKSPSFFEISIKNGVLYGYLVDIFNRSSELIILAVGMTLCVASSAGTDISVGAIMALSGAVSVYLLGSGETYAIPWIAAILIGFTSSSTFMLWLNCNQELARSYGMADPSKIQSLYALGTATAILATAAFIKKGLKEINVLILYPLISTIMLALCYFIQAPFICLVGGFVIGYAGAGGVLQLAVSTTAEFFPENKGTATSLVMIASSIANYTILSLAGYITKVGGSSAPRMILLLNMAVTIVGILLALFVKKNRNQ